MARTKKSVFISANSDEIAQVKGKTTVPYTLFGAGDGVRLRSSTQLLTVDPTSLSLPSKSIPNNLPVLGETPAGTSNSDEQGAFDGIALDPSYVAHTKAAYARSNKRKTVSVRS